MAVQDGGVSELVVCLDSLFFFFHFLLHAIFFFFPRLLCLQGLKFFFALQEIFFLLIIELRFFYQLSFLKLSSFFLAFKGMLLPLERWLLFKEDNTLIDKI